MTLTQTNRRGNATTIVTDLAGRTVSVTDATNAITTTVYDPTSDNPSCITNAQGKTTCYRYDLRGRKVAEWGTAVPPVCFGYDDADRLVSLTTFRVDAGDITTDPTGRTDGDTTTWSYHPASGLELSKTYADNSTISKTYDSFGRLATETNARGTVKTFSYLSTTGELSGIVFADDAAPTQAFTYALTGKLASVTDAAGTRAFTYNAYDELVSDSLTVGSETHLITESRDEFGRSAGFAYSEAGGAAGSEQYGYGSDGRLATAAFSHSGESKQFAYSYLTGTSLLQTLTMPNGMTLTQQYETQRDLLTNMAYSRGETLVVNRSYTYDSLGRPLTRNTARQSTTQNDSFTHNDRSELTAGILGAKGYYYSYDNIGNRKTAKEDADEATNYDANALNQYTAVGSFVPEFDADGNQTRVQTSTGIWNVIYNAENRPVTFNRTNSDGTTTRVTCAYDKPADGCKAGWTHAQRAPRRGEPPMGWRRVNMGRRATKKVETIAADSTATTLLHQRYIYRGYLQIAGFDLTESGHSFRWFITWDPTQPIQWSSEFYDDELGLVYYNYRHYNPLVGRWFGRDRLRETISSESVYDYAKNSPCIMFDYQGLLVFAAPLIPAAYFLYAALVLSGVVAVGYGVSEYADDIDNAIDEAQEEKKYKPMSNERCELECMDKLNRCNGFAYNRCKGKGLKNALNACQDACNKCVMDCYSGISPQLGDRFRGLMPD